MQAFPPNGGAGSGNGHADELADLERLVGEGKEVGVGVISFAHDNGGRFGPTEDGFATHIALTAREELQEGVAAEEGSEVFGEPAAAIEAGVDDERVLVGMMTED